MSPMKWLSVHTAEATERALYAMPPIRKHLGLPRSVELSVSKWRQANAGLLAERGITCTILTDARPWRLTALRCFNGELPRSWAWALDWKAQDRFYLEIPRGRVAIEPWRCSTAVFGPNEEILHETVPLFFHAPEEHPVRKAVFFSKPHVLQGRAFLLFNDASSNFYHWMCDILPRLYVAQCAGHGVGDFDWFLTDRLVNPFHEQMLSALGIPREKVVIGTEHRLIEADTLCTSSLYDKSGVVHREALCFVRDALSSAVKDNPQRRMPKRVYINRQKATSRRITNLDEIADVLDEFGFASVTCESLSLHEQVQLFRNATHIVAAHGAGLTNLMFCRPGTKVLEMLNESWAYPMYWMMCSELDLDYALMHVGVVPRRVAALDDLQVDVRVLRTALAELCG
jgi:capsular polysaccharide biosynthesis protein